jgi:hypothetical protein
VAEIVGRYQRFGLSVGRAGIDDPDVCSRVTLARPPIGSPASEATRRTIDRGSMSLPKPQTIYPVFPTSVHYAESLQDGDLSGYDPEQSHSNPDDDPRSSTIPFDFMKDDAASENAQDSASSPAHTHGDFDMLPPPSSTHPSWQTLHDYAQSHAADHGYALSINTTAKNRSRIKLACVCYGQPKNTHKLTPETRVRKNRVSVKTGCRMWIEGRRQDDGTWLLRVGQSQHNHEGRPGEAWAVQRKRTWGTGGRVGAGGVTAKEELARMATSSRAQALSDDEEGEERLRDSSEEAHQSVQDRELIWKIVELEMLRQSEPGPGRDRGVGRTLELLQARLPGIHILKRDIYNIRARIRRTRQAAGQQIGDGVNSDEDTREAAQESVEDDDHEEGEPADSDETPTHTSSSSRQPDQPQHTSLMKQLRDCAQASPKLPANASSQLPMAPSLVLSASNAEVEQLRREVVQLKSQLGEKTTEVKEKTIEIAGLNAQVEMLRSMAGMSS